MNSGGISFLSLGNDTLHLIDKLQKSVYGVPVLEKLNYAANDSADKLEESMKALATGIIHDIYTGPLHQRLESLPIPLLLFPVGIAMAIFNAEAILTGGRHRNTTPHQS